MHQKPQCHECMGTDLNMKATATKVEILLKLFHLLMHLFSLFPVPGSPTPSSIPAGNSAHSSEALSDFQCSSKNCLLLHSTQKSLRCCCFSSVCPSVTLSLSPIGAADIVFGLFSPLLPRYSTSAMLKLCGRVA